MKRFPAVLALTLPLLITDVMAATDLDFRGTLIAEPCALAAQSEEQTVNFGPVASQTFYANNRTAPRSFAIKLTECDLTMGTTVSVMFSGEPDSNQPDTFAVTGSAAGIAIALETKEGNRVIPGEVAAPVALSANETVLSYKAFVQGNVATAVSEGDFQSIVTFSLQYE